MSLKDRRLLEVLRRKAEGYKVSEVSEEFGVEEGREVLVKRKVSVKHVAPDLAALKLLLELSLGEDEELTAEQMEAEKQRLLTLLQNSADV